MSNFAAPLKDLAKQGRTQFGTNQDAQIASLQQQLSSVQTQVNAMDVIVGTFGRGSGTLTYLASDSNGRTYTPTLTALGSYFFTNAAAGVTAYIPAAGLYEVTVVLFNLSAVGNVMAGVILNDATVVISQTVAVVAGDQPEGLSASDTLSLAKDDSLKLQSWHTGGGTADLHLSVLRVG